MNTFKCVMLLAMALMVSRTAHGARTLKTSDLVAAFKGEGTAYSDMVESGIGFACSYRHFSDPTKKYFAAINSAQWDNGKNCGKCVKAWCVDDFCTVKNEPVTVMIVDKCPECAHGDLDFSIPAYREITGRWPHRLQVEWEWTDCDSVVEGTIKMDPKDGSNGFWNAFYVSNTKIPLKSLEINGQPFNRQEFNFWSGGNVGEAPFQIKLTGINDEVLTAIVDNLFQTNDLNKQFK